MLGIALGSALLLFLLKQPVVHHESLHQEEPHEKVNLEGIARGGGGAGVTLAGGCRKLWNLAKDPRFKWIVP
jgi:hypothetical protein